MPAPISTSDTQLDKFSKLLPADVTAALISTKAAILALNVTGNFSTLSVVGTYVVILLLCPTYFRRALKITDRKQRWILTASASLFAFCLAADQIDAALQLAFKDIPRQYVKAEWITPSVKLASIILPILWTYLVSQIAMTFTAAPTQPNE